MTAQPQAPPPHAGMMQLLGGVFIAGAISCLAQLAIPDLVEAAPKSADELASQIGADPQALYRLMRATACVGVLTEGPDGKFSQTPLSAVLRSNASPSLRALAIMGGREWQGRGWSRLEYCVRTGKQALPEIYGAPTFEFFKQHPEEARIFNAAMTDFSAIDSPAVADAYDFSKFHSVVDVAGGHGLLLATILKRNPQLKGTLLEEQHVISGAAEGPLKPVMDRTTLATGDMFSSVPAGADAYIMKHIIHDWPDDMCVKILNACRKGVNPGGKLLVVDSVIRPGNDFSPAKFLDLQMLIFPGGRERTEKQFRDLFAASDWQLNRIIPTAVMDSIVEGVPAQAVQGPFRFGLAFIAKNLSLLIRLGGTIMAKKSSLKDTAVKIGSAVGKADGKAHKAVHVAMEELEELSKQIESLKKQLKKSSQNLKSALK